MAFKVALLRGRKFMIEQDNFRFGFRNSGGDFIRLAAAGEKSGIGFGASSPDQPANYQASGFRQTLKLLGAFRIVGRIEIE
jgi:hypothetical protein